MVRVEQTEFWPEVTEPSLPPAAPAATRAGDAVAVNETANLTEWVLSEDKGVTPEAQTEGADRAPGAVPSPGERPRAAPSRPVYAVTPATKLNMARFLTLTGSLDAVEEEGRWLALPRDGFRPRVMLDAARRISRDFLGDLRAPPRSGSIGRSLGPAGWRRR